MTQITVQGTFDLSSGRLVLNFDNVHQLSNNQDLSVSSSQQPSSKQFPIIQKHGLRFCSSALGLAGGVGLLVSCIWSVLLPAIGSIGVIGIAYLANRKITLLNAKELSSAAAKSQDLFEQQIGSKTDSGSLLDQPVNTGNLPLPILPTSNGNIPPPPPLPGSLLDQPVNTGNLPLPILPTPNGNIPPPPPLPSALSMPLIPPSPKECQKTDSPCIDPKKPGLSTDPRDALLFSIRNSFNFMQIKELLREDPEKYSLNLLLKELKTTYERALAISESECFKDWKGYFQGKVDSFKKSFDMAEQEENQATEYSDMENICEKASRLGSLLKNMQWIKSLLQVLSERKDLSDKVRSHCSEKSKSIDKHIEKLQRRNEKKSEEVKRKEANTEESSSQIAKNPGEILLKAFNEIKTKEKTPEQKRQERYDAVHGNSSSESEPSDEGEWEEAL